MLKMTVSIFSLAALAYFSLCAMLFLMQRTMLYYPTLPVTVQEAKELRITNEGETLKVWHIPGGERAIVYFGGNAEDVSLNIVQFKRLFPQHSIYLHNYRGYGGSSGSPTEKGLFSDALALYDHLRRTHDDIAVIGRSLGTGIAMYLATEREVSRLALVTPFDSMARVAAGYYPFFPTTLLLRDKYDSLSRAERLGAPTLLLIAEQDEIIPRMRADSLAAALKPELTVVTVIPGAGHNTIGNFPVYEKALADFFATRQ